MAAQQPDRGPLRTEIDFREILATSQDAEATQFRNSTDRPELDPKVPESGQWIGSCCPVRIGRSGWTGLLFAAVASLGGLFCALHFFDYQEYVRPGTHRSREFLYPRPLIASGETVSNGVARGSLLLAASRGKSLGRGASSPGPEPDSGPSSGIGPGVGQGAGNNPNSPSPPINPNPASPLSGD